MSVHAERLPRLPIQNLHPRAWTGDADAPAILSRSSLGLCFVTRSQVSKLQLIELDLLRCKLQVSVLRGCYARFVSQGKYLLDRVVSTSEEKGQLVLRMQEFARPVPATCLSNTCCLVDGEWQRDGYIEVSELKKRVVAGTQHQPTCRELASACCRLSTAWLWAAQPEAFKAAIKEDPTAVAAQLEDSAAVAALLPCIKCHQPPGLPAAAAPAAAAPAAAAPAAAHGVDGGAGSKRKQQDRDQVPATAGSNGTAQQHGQQQQQQQQQIASGLAPADKRQRVDSQAANSNSASARASPQVVSKKQQASPQPFAGPIAQQQQQRQQLAIDLPPGSHFEQVLRKAVAACLLPNGRDSCDLSFLGTALRRLDINWKMRFPSYSLSQLAWELHHRRLIRVDTRKGNAGELKLYITNLACF